MKLSVSISGPIQVYSISCALSLTNGLKTVITDLRRFTEAATSYESKDYVNVPQTITWADSERDLTAWLGNPMQHDAILGLYSLERKIYSSVTTKHSPLTGEDYRRAIISTICAQNGFLMAMFTHTLALMHLLTKHSAIS